MRIKQSPEMKEAISALQTAENHLNIAETDKEIEIACHEITVARMKVDVILRQAKMEVSA